MDTNRTKEQFFHVSRKVLLRNAAGETLVLDCGQGKESMSGFWDLPGGRIHREERDLPLDQTIKREIFEEIGPVECTVDPKPVAAAIHVVPKKYQNYGEDVYVFIVLYESRFSGGEIKLSPEHKGYRWIDLKSVKPEEWFTGGLLPAVKNYLS